MDTSNTLSLLEQMDDEIDDLEEALAPLIKTALSETSSKLPLLDKAKLYVLVTYAIESILFSYLRLNGVNAREHPVFKELTRVKQYFEKLKAAESPVKRQALTLDKGAAGRIIKAGLSGNDKYDLELAEQQAKERAKAHIRFNQESKKKEQDDKKKVKEERKTEQVGTTKKRKAGATDPESSGENSKSSESDSEEKSDEHPTQEEKSKPKKKRKSTPKQSISVGKNRELAPGELTKREKKQLKKDRNSKSAT